MKLGKRLPRKLPIRKRIPRKLVLPRGSMTPTRFDLPIEYHIDYLVKRRVVKGRMSRGGGLRLSLFGEKANATRRSRFENLDPRFLYKQASMRPSYEFVRQLALEVIQNDVENKLEIIYNSTYCEDNRHADEDLPYKMFGWNRDDYLKRRKVPNTMWVNVLRKELSAPCLERLKFRTDLANLKTYVNLIFAGLMSTIDDIDINLQDHVFTPVESACDLVNMFRTVSNELDANKATFHDNVNILLNMRYKRDSKQNAFKINLEEKSMMAEVYDPIEMRYQINYYTNNADQAQYKADITEEQLEAEKARYNELIKKETERSNHACSVYFNEIKKFKSKINILMTKYDQDYEQHNNKISYTKVSIDKIKEQRQFCIEQMDRLREEVEALRIKQLAEEEKEREEQQKSNELTATQQLKKKKNKNTKKK